MPPICLANIVMGHLSGSQIVPFPYQLHVAQRDSGHHLSCHFNKLLGRYHLFSTRKSNLSAEGGVRVMSIQAYIVICRVHHQNIFILTVLIAGICDVLNAVIVSAFYSTVQWGIAIASLCVNISSFGQQILHNSCVLTQSSKMKRGVPIIIGLVDIHPRPALERGPQELLDHPLVSLPRSNVQTCVPVPPCQRGVRPVLQKFRNNRFPAPFTCIAQGREAAVVLNVYIRSTLH
mmetsp:Transcript_26024/g.34135  ORF Transcript_26024/g.34135 Transcript_26024/m.34135 type:complete len:233 (-) Transcript_26024:65-763(-)